MIEHDEPSLSCCVFVVVSMERTKHSGPDVDQVACQTSDGRSSGQELNKEHIDPHCTLAQPFYLDHHT